MKAALHHIAGLALLAALLAAGWWLSRNVPFWLGGTLLEELGLLAAAVALVLALSLAEAVAARATALWQRWL